MRRLLEVCWEPCAKYNNMHLGTNFTTLWNMTSRGCSMHCPSSLEFENGSHPNETHHLEVSASRSPWWPENPFYCCGNPKRSWRVILATYQEPRSKLVNREWPDGSRPLKWWMDPQLIYDASQTTRQETNKTPAADTDVSGNLFCTNAKCTRNVLTWRLGSIV